jgi:hypothetical protein
MLGALRRVSTNTRVVGTLVAFSVGIVAAVVARADDGDMTSTVRVALGATLGDLSKASLTRLPVPAVGAPTRVEAGALWRDRPAVILVLRRPG